MIDCPNCEKLWKMLDQARAERDEARKQSAAATDLMMKGESLRHKAMIGAILNGAFDTEKKKKSMAKIMTGKEI